jgi:short-subunit dehydrogenase
MLFKKKVFHSILITGASSGIGKELALSYATPNTTLYLSGRNTIALQQVQKDCQSKGATVVYHAFDITHPMALQNYIKSITTPIDLVIANAGASGGNRLNGDPESLETIDTLINVNLKAPIQLTRLLIKKLIQQKHGHLVYISSVQAFRGMPQSPTYCATKAGLKTYSEGLRAWVKNKHIDVSIVYLGFVKTAMSDRINCPKPFMISAQKAAHHIKTGISKNTPIIKIPKLYYYSIRLLDLLPIKWVDFLLSFAKVDIPEPRQ